MRHSQAIESTLEMISGEGFDWQQLIANTKWLALRMERESDLP